MHTICKLLTALCAAAVLAAHTPAAEAHEIPAEVTVLAFIKPEGDRLHLLVRVPLEAMRDIDFPLWGQGYLDIDRADPWLREAATLWFAEYAEVYEDERRLTPRVSAVRVSLPSDRSFGSWEDAIDHVTATPRLPGDTELYWAQAMFDVLLEYPIGSERSLFSLRPGFEWLAQRVTVVLRFLPPDGGVRAFQFIGDPGVLRLDPRWHQAALSFVWLGFEHILEGIDHLLFLLCLVIPFRRIMPLLVIVTSFTVAHSITLIASALGHAPDVLWFEPFIEMLIAASIVYMALENIAGVGAERRWLMAFGFGLVHGFGFSFILGETMQFAGAHLTLSLLAFNIGVELGQIFVLILLVPLLDLFLRRVVPERMGIIILSALVAHTGWHWMIDRADEVRQFPWPAFDAALLANLLQWVLLLVVVAAAGWLLGALRRSTERGTGDAAGTADAGRP